MLNGIERRRTGGVASALVSLALPTALAAQAIAPAEYAARRDSLAARLGNGVVIAFGAPAPTSVDRRAQLPAFRWLTGFLEPDAALVLVLRAGHARGILFTQPRDPRRALYDGFPPDSATVSRTTGLTARSIAALAPLLDSLASGGDGPAFGSIVGSGPNSTQYHYETNRRQMRAGDVVVMDVGAGWGGYAADVTRTVPVSGRFTPEQRAVYQIVRDAQRAAERVAGPGASYQAWRDSARAEVARGVARLGLTEGVNATFDPPWADQCRLEAVRCTQAFLYMAHGLGHGIGLEVHDPPHPWKDTGIFAPGDVFTIEPGVYVSTRLLDILPNTPRNRTMIANVRTAVARYDNIGIRIEDDYAITGTGLEWLSRAPREAAEIESAMARRGR